MALNLNSYDEEDDDYIDMEVSSYSNLFIPSTREFEFQMSSKSLDKDATPSPADDLFYKGKLLPLHLPPRLQMVEKLLENSATSSLFEYKIDTFEDFFTTPLATTPTAISTPFGSCNVSQELDPEEYFRDYSNKDSNFIFENSKKSWTNKIKLVKQSSLGSKLKASSNYLKNLFTKSGCSDESCAQKIISNSIAKDSLRNHKKVAKKIPFGQIKRTHEREKNNMKDDDKGGHRRSFSGTFKRHLTIKSSCYSSSSDSFSSSCSSNSNDLQFLKRSISVKPEIENSIQGAIAHCKESQQIIRLRKTASEVGFCSY